MQGSPPWLGVVCKSAPVFVPADGYWLNAVEFGSGPAFVAHGGLVGNWELWQEPFELLHRRWRCIGFDHRGSGASSFPPESISPTALVDDLFRVLDHFEVSTCVLAGESLGALTCLLAVLRVPERFDGLVLVDGAPAASKDAMEPLVIGSRSDYPANDVIVPVDLARAVAAAIPGAEIVVLPDTGHLPTMTRAQTVVDEIERWAAALATK